MSQDNDIRQIDIARVLNEVISIVCEFLGPEDLKNVAAVCKTWRYAALHEKKMRSRIKLLRFPYRIGNLISNLDEAPRVSLLIYDSTLEQCELSLPLERLNTLEEEMLERFGRQLPQKTVVWRVDEYLTTEEPKSCGNENQNDCEPPGNATLGLFFPSSAGRRLQVRVASFQEVMAIMTPRNRTALVNRLAEELGLDEGDRRNSAILLFSNGRYFNATISELVSRARQNCGEVGFANFFGKTLLENNCDREIFKNRKTNILLRISGQNLQCWSTYIDYFATKQEIHGELGNLEKLVLRKRFCMGLLFGRRCVIPDCAHENHLCGDSHNLMECIKRTFPGIQFVGFFENCTFRTETDYDQCNIFCKAYAGDFFMRHSLRSLVSLIIISAD